MGLLNMLNISPFTYGLVGQQVYDQGTVFSPRVLDITDEDLIKSFQDGLAKVASLSLSIGYPTIVSVPHSVVTDISFKEAEQLKEFLADPSKFAAATAAAAPAAAEAPKEEPKVEEEEEESDEDFGM